MIIGKKFTFEAAHHLPDHEKCGCIHGHTYELTVEIAGIVREDGMVLDLHELSDTVRRVIAELDHKDLNQIMEMPTCENLIWWIATRLRGELDLGVELRSVTLQEGAGGYAKI